MKFRRILAIMITVLMLISMMPTAMATACNHFNTEWRWPNGKPANCQDWKMSELYCKDCGEVTWSLEQCGDCKPGVWVQDPYADPPTCTEGSMELGYCKFCGEIIDEREVGPLGHNWKWTTSYQGDCTTPSSEDGTCTRCGATDKRQGSYGDHKWGNWNISKEATCTEAGKQTRKCSICGKEESSDIKALGHNWGDWQNVKTATCIQRGEKKHTCSRCGASESQQTDFGSHSWGEWKLVDKGDCKHPGKEERKCSVCGKTETRETEEGSHKWSKWSTKKDATCTEDGKEGRKCSLCGKEQSRKTDKLGHKWGPWVVIQEPDPNGQVGIRERKCSRCGLTEREEFYPDGTVQKGDRGDAVEDLQDKLNEQGYDCGKADGIFGNNTEGALKDWQEDNGFNPDGIFWPGQRDEMFGDDEGGDKDFQYVTVEKSIISTPANGEYYVQGETISFRIKVVIPEGKTITDLEVTDPLKGSNEDATLDILPTATSADNTEYVFNYVVTAEDVERGYVENSACAYFFDPDGDAWVEEWSETVGAPTGVAVSVSKQATLTKKVINAPENGNYFTVGETIMYEIHFDNPCEHFLSDIVIKDPLLTGGRDEALDIIGVLTGGAINRAYVVTEEDALIGFVTNTATAEWTDPVSGEQLSCSSNTVTTPCGYNYYRFEGIPGRLGGIEITKSVTNVPANGQYYMPGENVDYMITVKNTGSLPLEAVTVRDSLYSSSEPVAVCPVWLEPGEQFDASFSYRVTEINAVGGSIKNIAQVVGYDPEGRAQVGLSNEVEVLTGMDGDFPFGVITEMTIVKEETSTPANGTYYTEGEYISYKITYTNSGETPFTDVMIYDSLEMSLVEIGYAATLNPGESRTCTFGFIVTADDVAKGYVVNSAIAKYDIGGGYTNTAISNVVVSDTDGDPNTTYVPGTGKIDWEKIRRTGKDENGNALPADDSCYIKAVSRDGDSIEYEVHFCTKHAQTQNAILTMAKAAGDAGRQQMVWEYAYALWQKEIDAMYQEILPACDDAAKITVMSERVTHLAMVANTQFALKIAKPDQAAETAHAVADLWQDKCIDLCYLMNNAPSARVDSIFGVERAQNEAEIHESCACVITEEAEGKVLFEDQYCPVHGFTYEMMELLLLTENSVENWATVRSLWEIELNTVYNALYKAASEEGGMSYLAEYAAYLAWVPAYEQCLNMVYPNNPDIVAEVMANFIMGRALDACGRTK